MQNSLTRCSCCWPGNLALMSVARRLLCLVLVLCLIAASCGDDEDPGDLDAFCALVDDGTGMLVAAEGDAVAAGSQAEEFEELEAVAPTDIRGAVSQIANRERDLGEIDDLAELFDAAFSPKALQARRDYRTFVLEQCQIDVGEVVEEEPLSLVRGLRASATETSAGESWVEKVIYSQETPLLQETIVTITFRTRPLGDEAIGACNAASSYIYGELGQQGTVIAVVFADSLQVQRLGSESSCSTPK